MRIMLVQSEIEDALRAYVTDQGISLEGRKIEINMTAGRGSTGFYAELEITADDGSKKSKAGAKKTVGTAIAKAAEQENSAKTEPSPAKQSAQEEEQPEKEADIPPFATDPDEKTDTQTPESEGEADGSAEEDESPAPNKATGNSLFN